MKHMCVAKHRCEQLLCVYEHRLIELAAAVRSLAGALADERHQVISFLGV